MDARYEVTHFMDACYAPLFFLLTYLLTYVIYFWLSVEFFVLK